MVLASDVALDLAVSAVELNELARERSVSPPMEADVGEEGTCSEKGAGSDGTGIEGDISESGEEGSWWEGCKRLVSAAG